jgi:hypothetical protein
MKNPSPICKACVFAINPGRKARCNLRLKTLKGNHPLTGFPYRLDDLRPYCEDERRDPHLIGLARGTCGRSGRFFVLKLNPDPSPIHEEKPETKLAG